MWIDLKYVDDLLAMDQESALADHLYQNPTYDLIDDVITEMSWWACFNENEDDQEVENTFLHHPREHIPFRHSDVKVGRNDACPCGSGRKYKKCCGNSQQVLH